MRNYEKFWREARGSFFDLVEMVILPPLDSRLEPLHPLQELVHVVLERDLLMSGFPYDFGDEGSGENWSNDECESGSNVTNWRL